MAESKEKSLMIADDILKLPDDFTQKLIVKQLISPGQTDTTFFIVQNFNRRWFKNQIAGKLFGILQAYWGKIQAIPSREFLSKVFDNDKCKSDKQSLEAFVDSVCQIDQKQFNSKYLQQTIVRFTKQRALYFVLLQNLDVIQKHKDISCCFQKFEQIAKYDLTTDLGVQYFSNIDNHCQKLKQVDRKVSMGLRGLDYVTYGGLPVQQTCLMLYMAKPGLGKSMFMTNLIFSYILQNKKVLLITNEMSQHMYSTRFDSIISQLNINQLSFATQSLRKRVKALKLGVPDALLRIKEFPTGTCSTAMIKQHCKKLKEHFAFTPDLIVVDYLNIMRANSSQANSALYQKGKAIAEELRALSSQLKVPVVSAVQSNRSSGAGGKFADKTIDLQNAAQSSGIPATADVFFAIYQLAGQRDIGKIHLKIIKNRLGGFIGSSVPISVDYNCMKLADWDNGNVILEDSQGNLAVGKGSQIKQPQEMKRVAQISSRGALQIQSAFDSVK